MSDLLLPLIKPELKMAGKEWRGKNGAECGKGEVGEGSKVVNQ